MTVNSDINFSVSGENENRKGRCFDLSHRGIQFETDRPVKIGDIIEAHLLSENTLFEPMHITFTTLRIKKGTGDEWIVTGEIIKIDGKYLDII